MNSINIKSILDYKVKRFEKEIRRHLKKMSEVNFIIEGTNEILDANSFHAYMFKSIVDGIYNSTENEHFPFHMLLIYAQIFTLRNLKTDEYHSPFDDNFDLYMDMIDKNEFISLSIYDQNFLHKPDSPFISIACAVNKKRKNIIPLQFSKDISKIYPEWFKDGEIEIHKKVEVGVDFDLIEKINLALK